MRLWIYNFFLKHKKKECNTFVKKLNLRVTIFIYDDSYIGQSAPACCQAPAAIRGLGCTIYESSYIEFWNSEIELIYHDGNRDYTQMVPIGKSFKGWHWCILKVRKFSRSGNSEFHRACLLSYTPKPDWYSIIISENF